MPSFSNSRRVILNALAFVAAAPRLAWADSRLLPRAFDPARNAAQDLDTALRIAHASDRNVLVEVGGEWRSRCLVMDRFFALDTDLESLRDRSYIWLKINYSPENRNEALLKRWPKIDDYPHFFVLDASGRLLVSQDTSVFESGNTYNAAALRAFLVKWAPAR